MQKYEFEIEIDKLIENGIPRVLPKRITADEKERIREYIGDDALFDKVWDDIVRSHIVMMENIEKNENSLYLLMHKNICVAEITMDTLTGSLLTVTSVYNKDHLPVGVGVKDGKVDREALVKWWKDRCIPRYRLGITNAIADMYLLSPAVLPLKCYGLSLSDQYWVIPESSFLCWHDVNFFENDFSDDVGKILFGKSKKGDDFDFCSPDNTTVGYLKKRWQIKNGKRYLVKSGSGTFKQQPFNEVIASRIAERLGIPHVKYNVIWDDGIPYSVCENFVTENTELVTAWRVVLTQKKNNNTSVYRHYINCCDALGVKDIVHSIDQMIVLDYIIGNEDRHLNNFGLLRNADTLEWLGAAPVFDSGSSLGYEMLATQILYGKEMECKPFKNSHEEHLKLVTSFDWIDFDNLKGIDGDINDILSNAGEYIDEPRKAAIISFVTKRIEYLHEMAMHHTETKDDISKDVEEDVARNYGFDLKQ